MSILTNAAAPISSLTVSGRPDEVWHPSIIDFLTEHGLAQWPQTGQGWRYWLSMTTDHPEDVYLFVSNDGVVWQPAPHHSSQTTAPNTTQPTNSEMYGYWVDEDWTIWEVPNFSDGEIIYDPAGDQLFVYYVDEAGKEVGGNARRTVNNTLLLSAPEHVSVWDGAGANAPAGMWAGMSPTVIREDSTHYHFYSVTALPGTPNYDIAYAFSSDGKTTSGPWRLCTHNGQLDQLRVVYPNLNPNHIKAKANQYVWDQIELVVATRTYDTPSLTDIQNLVHIRTTLSNPTAWTAPLAPTPLLGASLPFSYWVGHEWDGTTSTKFDGYGLYRSEFVLQKSGSNLVMQLWYNGMNLPRFYGSDPLGNVGYTSGTIQSNVTWIDKPVIPKVARKLRSPSGGKIRGKGAGKVSGKPQ